MKKTINLLLTTMLSVFVLTSCSNSDNEILKSEKFHIPTKETSIGVSSILASTGTKSFDITKENGKTIFKANTVNTFYSNGEKINLSNDEFIIDSNRIYSKKDPNTYVYLLDDKIYLKKSNYDNLLAEYDNRFLENDIFILVLFTNELLTEVKYKKKASEYNKVTRGGCGFWDTYHVYSGGVHSGSAEENLRHEVASHKGGRLEKCVEYGDSSTSCLGENLGCVSMQSFCCS
ncbi:hypothetical protein ACPDHQ_07355 [Myroides odoratimimus]|uniref:hypothetical protein n=1 Tax=Myroides odoratimimus TaxID=76832 RepID=UPI003D2F96E5